jgi:hypothetical protein
MDNLSGVGMLGILLDLAKCEVRTFDTELEEFGAVNFVFFLFKDD